MIKYYPSFRIRTNLTAGRNQFTLNGRPYTGKYYETYDGKAYTGASPLYGKNELLEKVSYYYNISANVVTNNTSRVTEDLIEKSKVNTNRQLGAPVPYYPNPQQEDYNKGYLNRYFLKKENDKGYVMEISQEEYANITNGNANYDITRYQVIKLFWKLTGPLRSVRISQYDTRAGIIDTNERLVNEADKTFLGIKAFIGGEYSKFARPIS